MREIFNTKSEKLTRRAATKLNKVEQNLKNEFVNEENQLTPMFKELDWNTLKIGDTVLIKDLNQAAILVDMPDKNGNVKVQIGLMKTVIKKDKIAKASKNAQAPQVKMTKAPKLKREHIPHDLSLRGVRVDEALDTLEKYLDDASLAGLSSVCIIHGHGTGVLKEAVRQYLKDSPYIKKYRSGAEGEGSDGVTIADLK
jgi:DNA mismatch repair protein MutS2